MAEHADAAERTVTGSVDVLADATDEVDDPADTERVDTDSGGADKTAPSGDIPGFRLALVLGLATVLGLGGLGGWLGYASHQAQQLDNQRNRFLAVGEQGAVNLTTIDYTEVEADIARILDSSTGQFHDDFQKRAPTFVDVVKQAKSKTQGSITDAGLESVTGDSAQVLVAVAVNTFSAGVADPSVRHWRMRIDVKQTGDTMKVANVGFVP